MVNIKDNISHYIQEPASIQKFDLESLKQLAERYPYCSTLSILLLEGYHQFDFVSYENFLSKSAVLAPDRERLHQILEFQQEQETGREDTHQGTEPEVEETDPSEVSESFREHEEPVSEEKEDKASEVSVQEKDSEEEKIYDDFEKQLIASAVNSSILSEVEEEEAFDFSTFRQKKEEMEESNYVEEEQVENEEIEPSDQEAASSPESFIDFLKKVKHKKDQAFSGAQKDQVEGRESQSKPNSEKKKEQERKKEIVDDFIKSPKTSERPSFFSPVESAKKSLEENQENVSETLAKIHELQGNYGKAIQTYEKLILKIPEKKSFFASRIEELKKK